ncbi:glycosyltransferase [Microbacterium sp. QXD-8]|uniref:D-inositol 3-phosphate glycosyltransferase n=1 Tax=Microbacterium psychrotolerans TaxID=3068321 RepID=A0ABU0YY42_9MICO|nr:glycosyltransferase [Microbacterium sp. QXD-8]MDQ7876675.1 glycosyltransferase [Microbacterium sp. QXD-8]
MTGEWRLGARSSRVSTSPETVEEEPASATDAAVGASGGAARRRTAPRVLFVGINYAPEPTGIAPYTGGMAGALAARGWRVQVVTTHPHYPWWKVQDGYGGWTRTETRDLVDVTRLRHYVPRRHTMVDRALSELTFGLRATLARWHRPDTVVLVSPAMISSRLAAVRAALTGVPTIVWVQDIYTLGARETGAVSHGAQGIAALERGLMNSADRVVAIHDRFRRVLQEDLSVATPVDVVRNWSHVKTDGAGRDSALRRELGWGDEDVVVLHAGNIGAKQGLENVVDASIEAARRGSHVKFVLLGDGNQRPALEAMGACSRLQFLDPLPDGAFERALASADILLVNERPGLTEMAVPSKLTTYFATGLPVIAAVDPSSITHDEVCAAGAGPCVAAGDPSALVDAAERLAADPAGAQAFGQAARSYRDAHLGIDAAVASFEATLQAAMVSGRRAAAGALAGSPSRRHRPVLHH